MIQNALTRAQEAIKELILKKQSWNSSESFQFHHSDSYSDSSYSDYSDYGDYYDGD